MQNESIKQNLTSIIRHVYVVAYDSMLSADQTVYVASGRARKGTIDIQKARRFSTADSAEKVAAKLKLGHPRIEKHQTVLCEVAEETVYVEPAGNEKTKGVSPDLPDFDDDGIPFEGPDEIFYGTADGSPKTRDFDDDNVAFEDGVAFADNADESPDPCDFDEDDFEEDDFDEDGFDEETEEDNTQRRC